MIDQILSVTFLIETFGDCQRHVFLEIRWVDCIQWSPVLCNNCSYVHRYVRWYDLWASTLLNLSYHLHLVFSGINDVYDYETDRRNERKLVDGFEGCVLNPAHHKDVLHAAYLSTVFVFLSAFASQNRSNLFAIATLFFFAWQYSSPPIRMKEIPGFVIEWVYRLSSMVLWLQLPWSLNFRCTIQRNHVQSLHGGDPCTSGSRGYGSGLRCWSKDHRNCIRQAKKRHSSLL